VTLVPRTVETQRPGSGWSVSDLARSTFHSRGHIALCSRDELLLSIADLVLVAVVEPERRQWECLTSRAQSRFNLLWLLTSHGTIGIEQKNSESFR
jgi:hypothetical protein